MHAGTQGTRHATGQHGPLRAGLAAALLLAPLAVEAQVPPYRDAARPVAERTADLLSRMSADEKFWQLYMSPGDLDDPAHEWSRGAFGLQVGPAADTTPAGAARAHAERINAIQRFFVERTRLGIPIISFEEALHGLTRPGATQFPQAIALAATWDTALMERVATAIARETRSRGIRQVLSPVVNVATDVRWGRTEETYGEDPFLASRMAAAFTAPFARAGIIVTPKHFVANVGAGGRDSWPVALSDRALEATHYPPFRAALEAGAGSVMTAYNAVDGVPATQNRRLLTDVLRTRWGFTGFVISDAAATGGATVLHLTEPNTPVAAQHAWEAGLDVVFQSSWPQHRPYLDAVRRGLVAPAVIGSAVARVLRAKFALGLFEQPYADPDSAARWNGHADHLALALEAARASLVLLCNERGVLPLASPRSIAVIGTDAVEARLGGYSGSGIRPMSIMDGLRARAGANRVRYAPGPGRLRRDLVTVPAEVLSSDSAGRRVRGLRGEYFASGQPTGAPTVVRTDPRLDVSWTFNAPARGLPTDWYAVRWTGTIEGPAGGARRLGIEGSDGWRLWLDGRLVLDRWRKQTAGVSLADVALEPGRRYELRIEYRETTGNARLRLVWDAGGDNGQAALDSAVALARGSDVAIVVAGIEEGEFRDRAFLGLPGRQEELIRAVAATGRPTVVVLVGGSAVTMPWLEVVDAVLLAWYPGEQGGPAVAEALFGDVSPSGRLPISFPVAEGQLPFSYDHEPTGRGDDYLDLTGRPLFPLGYGLSYTEFDYSSLQVEPATVPAGRAVTVRATVRNSGTRAGDEVVQLYLRDVLASAAQPVLRLAAFRRVRLAAGASTVVQFTLPPETFHALDRDGRRVAEPGEFRVYVGASSRDIRLRGVITTQ